MEKKFEEITHAFDLTNEEILAKADQVAVLHSDINELEAEFERIKKSQKGTIEHKHGELNLAIRCIKTKKESRTITCEIQKDFDAGIAKYIFNDVVIKERDLTAYERQMHIDDMRSRKEKETLDQKIDNKIDEKLKDISAANPKNEQPLTATISENVEAKTEEEAAEKKGE